MAFLAGLGSVLGVVGGVAAFLVVRLVGLVSNLALLHRVGFALPNLRHFHPGPELLVVALGGSLVVVALSYWSPVIRGHGIPESLEAILLRESRIAPRVVVAKPISAVVAMGTGGPFGAEGPIIVTGGCIGSLLGQLLPVSAAERRILLATGAAAGMAGVFATPIAAVVLAVELLLFERSLRALVPLLIACGVATEVHDLLLGVHPLFAAEGIRTVNGPELLLFALLGLGAGVLAVVVNRGLFFAEDLFRRTPIPPTWHPVLGAAAYGLIGLVAPGSLSVGYWAITDAVNGRFLLGAAAVLFVAKLGSWWLSLASNTSGGTLAPIFLIGATMGEMVGIGFANLFPSLHVQPAAFALVAMGATFGAAARALLTGGVFALEVTGAYDLAVPMFVALVVAELVVEQFLGDRIMTDKLVRRGVRVDFDTQTDPYRMVVVAQVMEALPEEPLAADLPVIAPSAFLYEALSVFLNQPVDRVLVAEPGGRAVGSLTRSSLEEALARRLAEDTLQPPALLQRAGRRQAGPSGTGRRRGPRRRSGLPAPIPGGDRRSAGPDGSPSAEPTP
jgi:CIC family chloride channel protein